ncbi:transposase [Sulfobacillus thermotolerans]|uniref:transposase n=1 Tax=Sulfobacillus thermotolerans TaxID=338644 RepID=UPI0033662791
MTAKVPWYPNPDQATLLQQTVEAYRQGCHGVSGVVDTTHCLQQADLHTETYRPLWAPFGLRSQMAQSVIKTVMARYNSVLAHGHPWTRVPFTKPAFDLVCNRDDSLKAGAFSLNTLAGRVPIPFARQGMERVFDGTWQCGTAPLVHRHGRWFLPVPMTKDVAETDWAEIRQVVGLDFGINVLVTAYDSQGQTTFFPGRAVKVRRDHFKILRQTLQRRQTPSARRRLKRLGQRENRWMTDVNHQVSKALVVRYWGPDAIRPGGSDGDAGGHGAGPATGSVYVRVVVRFLADFASPLNWHGGGGRDCPPCTRSCHVIARGHGRFADFRGHRPAF